MKMLERNDGDKNMQVPNEKYSFSTEEIHYSALERRVFTKLNEMRRGDEQERRAYDEFETMLHNENYSIEILCKIVESNIKAFYAARAEGRNPFDD